ncbi:hypothetical protein jhhlp_002210 [Lomentospora prolificans]|uniref:Tr-type G domain-containing protein n=1 Tax=Lomentospora prolificans TaxID=41688 RepID=A0A2N3NDF8_9PEZI|nr:hypothetical protein jhhlp_002210 [Lomentospora prolificans]
MASLFSFVEPARVASPWKPSEASDSGSSSPKQDAADEPSLHNVPEPGLLSEYGISRLGPEPQEGPIEYKLHLLLRPRRVYSHISTAPHISGSVQARPPPTSTKPSSSPPPPQSASSQSRQQRLSHLTTQLLWRLKQSAPNHVTSSRRDILIPRLPEDIVDASQLVKPEKLPVGLEESQGALYEIGVSDDGTLVGLTKDELDESILVLRNMAASLGCDVKVLRVVEVGLCEFCADGTPGEGPESTPMPPLQQQKLWVCEALVTPDLGLISAPRSPNPGQNGSGPVTARSATAQLRVTLTGPSTAGKSTLLGTLSTGTLDNGEGSSRLGLLKHRHEVVSGVTSSVAQELIGYKDDEIFNFGCPDIESWINIHDGAEDGRLVFVSDSAGATRFRRTILRGLVGWAPHWIILCIAADDKDFATGANGADAQAGEQSLNAAAAHLGLCLKLGIPLAVLLTKGDASGLSVIKPILERVMGAAKAAGREPHLIRTGQECHSNLTHVPADDVKKIQAVVGKMDRPVDHVPIVLTSSVMGKGIGLVHALLAHLPMPPTPTAQDFTGPVLNPEQPVTLFHIEEKYNLPARHAPVSAGYSEPVDEGTVVSGYLRFGDLQVGHRVVVGPFPPEEDDDSDEPRPEDRPSPGSYSVLTVAAHQNAGELARLAIKNAVSASKIKGEWHDARVVSIRNLRLAVNALEAGQVGSIGIVLDKPEHMKRIRKGMVIAVPSLHMVKTGVSLQAASGLTALFTESRIASLAVGNVVSIYIASVRTTAKVVRVAEARPKDDAGDEPDDVFKLDDQLESGEQTYKRTKPANVEVSLDILSSREWIEVGSQILVLEGGRSGLDAFVGKVVEVAD